jgi:hypothetical protein
LTTSSEEAINFLCADLMPARAFPVDRLWIAPTNRLAMEINNRIQNWKSTEALHLGIIKSINQFTPQPELAQD